MRSRYDELARLQRLREAGVLSEEEFQAEKKRVLGGGDRAPMPGTAFAPVDETVLVEEEDPEAEARRKRNILYAVVAAVGLLIAIVIGIALGRDVSGGHSAPEANVAMPAQNVAVADENMIVATPPTDVRTLPMPEQLSRAFAAAFGTGGAATLQVGGRTSSFKPGRLSWNADRAILISPGTASDDCHACSGTLAVHYLEPQGDGFKVTGSWPDAVAGSGWGAAPKWKLTSAFTTYPAIYEEGGYTGQGCTSGGVTITELTPQGPVQSVPIRTIYSNAGATVDEQDPGEVEGTIANVQKDQSFDVNYSGAQPFTEHWVKSGARFVLQGGETRMPQC